MFSVSVFTQDTNDVFWFDLCATERLECIINFTESLLDPIMKGSPKIDKRQVGKSRLPRICQFRW